MAKKQFSLKDLGIGGSEYVSLSEFVGKTITILSCREEAGKYGEFKVLTLKDGTEIMTSGEAVVKVIEAAEEQKAFPLTVSVEKQKSKKTKGRAYFVFR